jgi:hypothetical protein
MGLGLLCAFQSLGLVTAQEPEVLRTWSVTRITVLNLMPDIDGDGNPELLAGNHIFSTPEINSAGVLRVLSSSGNILFEHVGTFRNNTFGGASSAVGDVNGDGLSDYMGSGGFGQAKIFSGRDGSLLFTHVTIAQDAAPLGDVDRDGFEDFLLGSGNRAFFYLGSSFELRQVIVPPANTAAFGQRTVCMGDIDGDAFVDFAVGAPGCGCSKGGPSGEVFVYSGRAGELLYRLVGEGPVDEFGRSLEAPGDLTGDGVEDLAVGAYQCCSEEEHPGRLYFFDGKTGVLLRALDPVNGGNLASSMDEIDDLDGNGFADILVSMPRFQGVSGLAVDGHTHELIYEYSLGFGPWTGGGHDWNRDGFPDFLVASLSQVELRSGAPPGTEVLGQPCGSVLGQAPRIGATGIPSLGRNYPLHLTDVPADVPAILRIGLLAIRPDPGQRGCSLLSQPFARFPVTTEKIAPGRGAASIELPIPPNPVLQGLHFSAQWTVLDTRGRPLAVTRILRPTIGG